MKRILDERFALRSWVGVASLSLQLLLLSSGVAAEPSRRALLAPAEGIKPLPPAEAVKSALQREIYGQGRERAELLAAAVKQAPAYAPALWQLGQVRDQKGRWQAVEEYVVSAR